MNVVQKVDQPRIANKQEGICEIVHTGESVRRGERE